MFEVNKSAKDAGLSKAIESVYSEMDGSESYTEEYSKSVNQLIKLYSLKQEPKRVSPDTLAIVVGNIIVASLIIAYESRHIVTTKAPQFLLKWIR